MKALLAKCPTRLAMGWVWIAALLVCDYLATPGQTSHLFWFFMALAAMSPPVAQAPREGPCPLCGNTWKQGE